MKNKMKFLVIIFLFVAIGLVFSGVFILNTDNKGTKGDNEQGSLFYDLSEKDKLTINNCKKEQCEITPVDSYNKLIVKGADKVLQEKIDKINKDTKAYYDMVKESTTDNDKCAAVKDLYYHEYSVRTQYYNYESDKYISIGVQRDISNLCDNSYERTQVEWYLYEKSSKKLLTQAEYKEKEGINNHEMAIAIKNVVNQINQEESLAIDPQAEYTDKVVFYDFQGNILISFFVPEKNLYYTGTVRKIAN